MYKKNIRNILLELYQLDVKKPPVGSRTMFGLHQIWLGLLSQEEWDG